MYERVACFAIWHWCTDLPVFVILLNTAHGLASSLFAASAIKQEVIGLTWVPDRPGQLFTDNTAIRLSASKADQARLQQCTT